MKRVVTFADGNANLASASRRTFLMQAGTSAGILAAGMMLNATTPVKAAAATPGGRTQPRKSQLGKGLSSAFWPEGIRMVISISMQFEAGGQPPKGTDSPFPKVDFPPDVPADAAANTWFAYGYREGIPRMLDLWDRHGVKVTSHMIGEAAQHHPELAKEIVARGHEASGHGPRWSSQYAMSREEERQFLIAAREMVEAATGQRPVGYNCNWLRRGPNTLSLLQELGYLSTYIMEFTIQTFGQSTFTLSGGPVPVTNAGTKVLNGPAKVSLVFPNLSPVQQVFGFMEQTAGSAWSWFSTSVQFPPIVISQ
jgi:peptidoglycan/xylan/chitin deacetylase (PgdA/CDA1 family)